MSDTALYEELARAQREREPRALVTVIDAKGSVPRDRGAKMLVAPDGRLWGTIGGGKMESLIVEAALDALRTGEAGTREYPLHEGSPASFGAICGGVVTVFIEPLALAPRVLMVGSGHCAQALARAARTLGWAAAVVEDRAALMGPEHFPAEVARRPVENVAAAMTELPLDRATAVCLLNRNADLDRDCLETLLRRAEVDEGAGGEGRRLIAPFYIGMIGSRKKVDAVSAELRARGIDDAQLALVHTPIGVEIYAETPQEIAVSILAEVIREWRVRQPGGIRTRHAARAAAQ